MNSTQRCMNEQKIMRRRRHWRSSHSVLMLVAFLLSSSSTSTTVAAFLPPHQHNAHSHRQRTTPSVARGSSSSQRMVSQSLNLDGSYRMSMGNNNDNNNNKMNQRPRLFQQGTGGADRKARRKYKRKRIPDSEKEIRKLRSEREAEYKKMVTSTPHGESPSLWSFECLFPDPVWDEASVRRDLFSVKEQDRKTQSDRNNPNVSGKAKAGLVLESSSTVAENERLVSQTNPAGAGAQNGVSPIMGFLKEPRLSAPVAPNDRVQSPLDRIKSSDANADAASSFSNETAQSAASPAVIDRNLTRMVEDRLFGYRRTKVGNFEYDTSLMGDGAIQFRDGVRLGNPLSVNADRLTWMAKKELGHGRIEEAQELYERSLAVDPRDGRAYLGLSRCAQRRRDFTLARDCLETGLRRAVSVGPGGVPDRGGNPFLLQALGVLEERMGNLGRAESLYVEAVRSRPSHAAAWVALAQLRTRKLGQSTQAGRSCYQSAEAELQKAGLPASSHVYTAWAALEYRKGQNVERARKLFGEALKKDERCSAAYLQLGVMEADQGNYDDAQACFDKVLKFDQRNTRVLQAYALMESKRPEGDSRKAIGLFERALKANPRDGGVLQAYALYVADLGDIDAARELLRRGTELDKRNAPIWQAWGVLETRHGRPEDARNVFQQGIWACAQMSGGQSGGYRCARLWQAWGVLEARVAGDHAAARRCFGRALDADQRNVPAMTAWAGMEEELGNIQDARAIFERGLKMFAPGSEPKTSLWRSYELMEQRLGDKDNAQRVFQRAMRESMAVTSESSASGVNMGASLPEAKGAADEGLKISEVEVERWNGDSLGGEVWMNDRAIESKMPRFPAGKGKKRNRIN